LKKKKNTEVKQELSPIQLKVKELEDAGATHALILAMNEDELLMINSTLPAFEQMHAILNRAMFEITINHHKYILAQKEGNGD